MKRMPPDFGALGFHWSGRGWFVDLYLWHRGPWRLSGAWYGRTWSRIWAVETPGRQRWVQRIVTDIIWGLARRRRETPAATAQDGRRRAPGGPVG